MKKLPQSNLATAFKRLGMILLFPLALFSHNNWAPIMMDDIMILVPFSKVKVSLGADRVTEDGNAVVITPTIDNPSDVASYVWSEGGQVLSTGSTFSTASLGVGTHTVVLTITDINGITTSDTVVVTIEDAPDELDNGYSGGFVGTTKGAFSVNQGTANYTLDIDVPPGIAGMEPKLSLAYSSGGGNGYMGIGWSMQGVSAITRCAQTKAVDGNNHEFGVHYDSNDRFCLDGQRLIVVSGSYGAAGSKYRTEINNYSKITLFGDANDGTGKFEVKTKSGLIYHYGYTDNSSPQIQYAANRFWKVSSIEDSYGNTIDFNYYSVASLGEHYLSSVTYGNGHSVEYHYTARPDKIEGYQAGYLYMIQKRLSSVVVKADNHEIRRYDIEYQRARTGFTRSMIKRITEVLPEATLEPLDFTWNNDSKNNLFPYILHQSTTIAANGDDGYNGNNDEDNYPYLYTPDINGDGRSDICYRSDTGIRCYLNNDGTFPSTPDISTGICGNNDDAHACESDDNWRTIRFVDMNGDGLADLFYRGDDGIRIYKSTGSGFTLLTSTSIVANGSDGNENNWKYIYTPDYNGDGKRDICYRSDTSGITCYANDENNSFTSTPPLKTFICKNGDTDHGICRFEDNFNTIRFVDMNSDGCADILFRSNYGLRLYLSEGSGFTLSEESTIAKNSDGFEEVYVTFDYKHIIKTPDMNGDGLPDICYRSIDGIKCYTNTGGHFSDMPTISTTICANGSMSDGTCNDADNYQTIQFVDTDGDGLVDLTYRSDEGLRVWKNKGNKLASSPLEDTIMQNHQNQNQNNYLEGKNDYDNWGTKAYFDIDGDGMQDFFYRSDSGIKVYRNRSKTSLVTDISNGKDEDITLSYAYMTDSDVYTNNSVNGYRSIYAFNDIANNNIELTLPIPLVSRVERDNGLGSKNALTYTYDGYILNKDRGIQGFHAIRVDDLVKGMHTLTEYKQIGVVYGTDDTEGFQFTGMPYAIKVFQSSNNRLLNSTEISYKDASSTTGVYEPYSTLKKQESYAPERSDYLLSTQKNFTTMSTDGYGDVLSSTEEITDGISGIVSTKETNNTYDTVDVDTWHLGRLSTSELHQTVGSEDEIITKSTFEYNTHGLLSKEVSHAEDASLALTKTYTYYDDGNKETETVSGAGIDTATTTYEYDGKGRFPTTITDALGYSISKSYNQSFGTVTSLTDASGLTTTWEYDGMGRKVKETRPDGTKTVWSHEWVTSANNHLVVEHALYTVSTRSDGAPFKRTYYDSLGRDVGTYTYSIASDLHNSRRIQSIKKYNVKGELEYEELPHYEGETIGTIDTIYDDYGRVTSVTKTGAGNQNSIYTTSYAGNTQTLTDPYGRQKRTVRNAFGQITEVTDAYGSSINAPATISYIYDSAGNLKSTTDSDSNVITMWYDTANHKIKMTDPDLGEWHYGYNALGQLKKQWSGSAGFVNSKHASYKNYDILGRVTRDMSYNRQEYNANHSTYSYNQTDYNYYSNNATKGSRGKVKRTTSSSRMKGKSTKTQTVTSSYDTLGRPSTQTTTLTGRPSYTTKTTYDRYSRISSQSYPNNYRIINHYQNGILDSITGSDGKVHYQAKGLNAFGQISRAHFANGVNTDIDYDTAGYVTNISSYKAPLGNIQALSYAYDALGNVVSRYEGNINGNDINETFSYDYHNRLHTMSVYSEVLGNYAKEKVYSYLSTGNIESVYAYSDHNKWSSHESSLGHYSYSAVHPHAVESTIHNSYSYDSVGNMTDRNGDTITYNPLNKPATLSNHLNNKTVTYHYGAGGQRYLKETSDGKQTYYLGKAYEEEIEGNEITQRCYLSLGAKTIGVHETKIDNQYSENPSNPHYKTVSNKYFHSDALGSITTITNDSGEVIERRSYEPFGKIRAMDYGLTSNHAIIPTNTVAQSTRAFTGHEQIAELSGLIHMNARVYDSDIGRFLSADTTIQDPHDTQSYNRYSYVRNNPLKYTDPSGHSWWLKHGRSILIGVTVAVLTAVTGGLALGALGTTLATAGFGELVFAGAVGGFVGGFASGVLQGATVHQSLKMGAKGALYGAIGAGTANLIGGIGSSVVRASLHGLTRAAITRAQGGKFSAGFWSGLASSALAPLASNASTFEGKIAMNAIVGGTASELGGGKFANGAVSAAFVMMYNEMAHAKSLQSKYKALKARVQNAFSNNKNAIVDLSNADLKIMAQIAHNKAVSSTDSYIGAMGRGADTFLRDFGYSSNSFKALGSTWLGGQINYIAVGAYNTVYMSEFGSMLLNPAEAIMWNSGQYINSGFTSGDMSDIPANLFWMNYGSTHGGS